MQRWWDTSFFVANPNPITPDWSGWEIDLGGPQQRRQGIQGYMLWE